MRGPAWLGIGAQRSGTTWFTDLLCQHPLVDLGCNGVKEQRALHEIADGRMDPMWYLELFDDGLVGEFTPLYLRYLSTPRVAATLCRPEAPFIVLLRDPVERFVSAMRRYVGRKHKNWPYEAVFYSAQWAGMYADQLDVWALEVGRDRLVVLQYEWARRNPRQAVEMVWRRIGVDAVPLRDIDRPSSSSSKVDWNPPDGLLEALVRLYRPQVRRLAEGWDVDPALWPSS